MHASARVRRHGNGGCYAAVRNYATTRRRVRGDARGAARVPASGEWRVDGDVSVGERVSVCAGADSGGWRAEAWGRRT